ncbi:type 4b pilus protein PilO2 [Pseudomonas sp. CAH-1]|uniref:type 4b pilus protein PilO2 n=1 Tax=Pseudomonas TaxID=286 RepID=UPI0006D4194F|nr:MULTISPECIES: type 4b pilus protein PilO2 [Pseudomonas]MBH3372267.1 type 4b pilus protein PilO2 [Pseudomonas juntendi]MBS6036818.1 type 4b pilus protein PilO2 [Pseudomonas sp.]MRT61186.1 type 4b pilus protein PilO2 [Pseudomonas sp. CAH-1]
MSTENPASRTSRVQILHHRGRAFVTGLRWHPLGSVTGHMKEARQFGKDNKLDIVTIRRNPRIIQAGFVARTDGVTKGMYSLASTLAGQLGESWIAAWRVSPDEDRYAVVAVHKGGIIPGCDVIGSEVDIRRRVAQQRSRGIEFEEWYLPPEFDMGGKPLDVDELLQPSRLKREYRLRPLVFGLSRAELSQLAIAGLVVTAGLIGWTQWSAHQKQVELEERLAAEQRRLDELARLERESGSSQPDQALEHPWAKQPSVEAFVARCSEVIYTLPPSIDGWLFIDAVCDGSQILTTYNRTGNSTATELISATRGVFSGPPAFSNQGNSATLPYAISLPAAGDEPLLTVAEATASLTSALHRFSQEPTLTEVPVDVPQEPALPGQPAPPPPPPPEWRQFKLEYSTGVLPHDSLSDASVQGLRLRVIKAENQADHLMWTVTGDLYAK